jgi:hypothetical protein
MSMLDGKSISLMGRKVRPVSVLFAGVTRGFVFALLAVFPTGALAQCVWDNSGTVCVPLPDYNSNGPTSPARPSYDPCFLAQNAMRPCTSDQQTAKPTGVDPNLVGTWEIPFKGGPWVLNIEGNGAYQFHSEAHDGVKSHTGSFSAGNGHWSLKAKTGYTDAGDYLFQAPDIFIATGQSGTVAWLRPALAQNAMRSCTSDQRQLPKAKAAIPTGIDANIVGTWKLPLKNGSWVWEVRGNGTYKFHSEAHDGAPSHAGSFSAGHGHWSLSATTGLPGYKDSGLYLFQAPNIWMLTGKLGDAAWLRPASTFCNAAP